MLRQARKFIPLWLWRFCWKLIHYWQAARDDPRGLICCNCKHLNWFFDDAGWFYIAAYDTITLMPMAICEQCRIKHYDNNYWGDR